MEVGLHSNDRIVDKVDVSPSPQVSTQKRGPTFNNAIKFLLIPLIPLITLAIISTDPNLWKINGTDHFYFEMISVILSFIVAYYCILRGYTFKDKFSLFVGLGFHVAGIIDLLHGTFALLNLGNTTFEGYFIPQTWVAGRIVLGAVLAIAMIKSTKWHSKKISGTLRRSIFVYTTGLAGLATLVTFFSLAGPFPYVIIDFLIQRPYEIIAAGLFTVALVVFWKNRLFLKNDMFFKGIMITLLIDIFVNLIISYSTSVFDTAFNFAHILKNISYFILILAISGSVMQRFNTQKALTQTLELNEQKFRSLYETSPNLLRTIDTKGIILDCNERYAKTLGYAKKEIIGSSIFNHVPKEKLAEMKKSFQAWKKIGRVGGREVTMQRKDGTIFPALITATGIYNEKGNLIGSNTSIIDLTEIQKAKEQLQEEKIKRLTAIGELSARIAHDLRNPMSVIKNTIELVEVELDVKRNEKIQKKFDRINRAIIRINHQVENVLDFVKNKPLQFENTPLQPILAFVIDRINVPLDVTINLPKNDIKVYCDFEKLEIVFINLITNAIQAMSNKGEINIMAKDEADQVVIEVSDSGPGIAKEYLSKIFDPLFTTRQVGTGLGLPSCKNIIEKHSGTIVVQTRLGEGTTFVIKLPRKLNLVTVDAKL